MRLAGYLRVSTRTQVNDGDGLGTQRDQIVTWCRAHGHLVVSWHADEGISGSNGIETRAALAEALATIGKTTEGMVVKSLDRFARSLVVQEQLLVDIQRRGGVLLTTVEAENAHLDDASQDPDPTRTMIRQIVGAVAEYERGIIRARLLAGQRRKKAKGGYAAGSPAYGWASDGHGSLVPIPAEQAQIDLMRALREAGTSYRGIVALLEQAKVPARRGRWHPEVIRRILVRDAGAR